MADSSPTPPLTLITSPVDLGGAVREARNSIGMGLRDAAAHCRVGVRFLRELEGGKPTARLDKVLQVMFALNLIAIVVPLDAAMEALGPKP
ncbi:MAG: transcriptional regulator [Betaproteobacteria bacterium]